MKSIVSKYLNTIFTTLKRKETQYMLLSYLTTDTKQEKARFYDTKINSCVLYAADSDIVKYIVPSYYYDKKVIKIGSMAFANSALRSIFVSENVKSIESKAFQNCTDLSTIIFSENLTKLGADCFYFCTSLKKVILPDSLKEIGEYCFGKCNDLYEIYVPKNLEKILSRAFWDCESLREIYINSIEDWCRIDFCDKEANPLHNGEASLICKDILMSQIQFSNQIKIIKQYAFIKYNYLTSIKFSNTLTSIGEKSFFACENLETVDFAEDMQLKVFGIESFANCTSLNSITIPKSVESIEYGAFEGCENLKEMKFERRGKDFIIDDVIFNKPSTETFEFTNEENNIEKGESLRIDERAFCNTGIEKLELPKEVNFIGEEAFYGCKNLKSVEFEIGAILESFEKEIFSECSSLEEIRIPANVKSIGEMAFYNCQNLKVIEFELNSKLEIIESQAFANCINLEKIILPESVKEISDEAFANCKNLKGVYINTAQGLKEVNGCSNIEIGRNVFAGTQMPDFDLLYVINKYYKESISDFAELFNMYGLDYDNIKDIEAELCENEDFEYLIYNNKIYLTKLKSENKVRIKIPNEIDGLPVVYFGKIFKHNINIKSVVLSKNTRYIDGDAFDMCIKLKKTDIELSN